MRPSPHRMGNDHSDGWNPELTELARARSAGPAEPSPTVAAADPEPAYETSARVYSPDTDRGDTDRAWQDIKSRFVDDPAGALEAALALVQSVMDQKVRALKDEAAAICERDGSEDTASTEDMRTRLIRCQAYCERLARTSS